MNQKITIDPITRLEGHGKIVIFLDESGNVSNAYLQVPELRGFEKFCEGRPAEEMPVITSRICGVCPTAHHMASTKALDDLWKVEPPESAKKIRELFYSIFMLEDHMLHFFYLGGPDFIVGPMAPKEERSIIGVLAKVGLEVGSKVIKIRKELRELLTMMGGKVIHPVLGVPGGVIKPLKREEVDRIKEVSKAGIEFALFVLGIFDEIVLKNKTYVDLITSEVYCNRTYYGGLVDDNNKVNFYDGWIRFVKPNGEEYAKFKVKDYLNYIGEHVEEWSYIKFPFLKSIGWKGFMDGEDSGIYRVAPLARLNAADGMATPLAQAEYEKMYNTLGGKPIHFTLAFHWARLIEALYAAENMANLANDPDILDPKPRIIPTGIPDEGVGVVEAPRGLLIHHYKTDKNGIIEKANIIVATQHNAAAINLGIQKAAKFLIRNGNIEEGILNMIEITFRAYDPCHACGTHALPGHFPIKIVIYNHKGEKLKEIKNYY